MFSKTFACDTQCVILFKTQQESSGAGTISSFALLHNAERGECASLPSP